MLAGPTTSEPQLIILHPKFYYPWQFGMWLEDTLSSFLGVSTDLFTGMLASGKGPCWLCVEVHLWSRQTMFWIKKPNIYLVCFLRGGNERFQFSGMMERESKRSKCICLSKQRKCVASSLWRGGDCKSGYMRSWDAEVRELCQQMKVAPEWKFFLICKTDQWLCQWLYDLLSKT